MRAIVLACAVFASIAAATQPACADDQALELLKLSLACSGQGTHGHKDRGFNYSLKLAYQYKGDAKLFAVREIHHRIGERQGRAISEDSFLQAKVDFHAVKVATKGATVTLQCKSDDECIEYITSVINKDHKATNVVLREGSHEWQLEFCNASTAQDFAAAFEELAK